jgi:hypothetical protein
MPSLEQRRDYAAVLTGAMERMAEGFPSDELDARKAGKVTCAGTILAVAISRMGTARRAVRVATCIRRVPPEFLLHSLPNDQLLTSQSLSQSRRY